MPRAAPIHWVEPGMPASLSRRLGTRYFTTPPATSTAAATPKTAHAVVPPTSQAQTRIAASTRTEPGRIGTRMPTSPTAMARATRTSTPDTSRPFHTAEGPGSVGSGAFEVGERRVSASASDAELAEVLVSVSLSVSSTSVTAICLSLSPCSRAWCAQNRSSPPGLELHAKVGLGAAPVAAVRCGQRRAGCKCSVHDGLISLLVSWVQRRRGPQRFPGDASP